MAENIPNRKDVIESNMLIGLDITEVRNKLGYWWVCSHCDVNCWTGKGVYVFNRAGHGRLEVHTQHTQDENGYQNLVVEVL